MANNPRVKAHFASLKATDYVFTCTIVRGEILYGIERLPTGRRRRSLENQAANLFSVLPCQAIPEEAANHYGRIKRQAEQQGTPLDENDLWIAATTYLSHYLKAKKRIIVSEYRGTWSDGALERWGNSLGVFLGGNFALISCRRIIS